MEKIAFASLVLLLIGVVLLFVALIASSATVAIVGIFCCVPAILIYGLGGMSIDGSD